LDKILNCHDGLDLGLGIQVCLNGTRSQLATIILRINEEVSGSASSE